MTDDRDLERLVRDSLDDRAARLPASRGRLMSVLDRVERRRNRRRRSVAVGSVAVVGLGVVGLMTTGGTEPDLAVGDGDGTLAPVEPTASTTPVTIDLGEELWWACTDELTSEDGVVYYASCARLPTDARLLTTDELRDGIGSISTTTLMPPPSTPSSTPPTSFDISDEEQTYTIVAGDSVAGIAARFGIDMEVLAAYNEWPAGIGHLLLPGQTIVIPPGANRLEGTAPTTTPEQGHVIEQGDSPTSIAELYAVDVDVLIAFNEGNPAMDEFAIGQLIRIPPGGTEPDLVVADGGGTLVPADPPTLTTPVTIDLGEELWWACTDELDREDGVVYYARCEQLPGDARLITADELSDPADLLPTTSVVPTPPTNNPTTTLPPGPIPLLAIGDFEMRSAEQELTARGYTVLADEGRQMSDMVPIMVEFEERGVFDNVVVIHLGTSGPFDRETLDAFLAPLSEVPNVIILNNRVERSWTASNNQILADRDQPGDNIILIDWRSTAAECSGNCFGGDGTELAPDGIELYADTIGDITGR